MHRSPVLLVLAVVFASLLSCRDEVATSSYPVYVSDTPFASNGTRSEADYIMLDRAASPWRIAVAIPHLKDDYWNAVIFGLIDQARELNVSVEVFEAGGYEYLDVQRQQLLTIIDEMEMDGIILASISQFALSDVVDRAHAAEIPVVDLINGFESPFTLARVASSFFDHGQIVAEQVLEISADGPLEVAWFPGPEGAGWVGAGTEGFLRTLAGTDVTVHGPYYGDTGHNTQETLVRATLADHPGVNIVAGTAVTAEVAVQVVRDLGIEGKVTVLSYYYSAGVHRGIKSGQIAAAPTDVPAIQARIALDTMVRALEGQPYYEDVAPRVQLATTGNIDSFDASTSLAPVGFRPALNWEAR